MKMHRIESIKHRRLGVSKWWLAGIIFLFVKVNAQEQVSPPIIPIGLDAYRMWDEWPIQRIGDRAYMRSTYDRLGGNEGADASHFLFVNKEDYNVTLDVAGKGVLYFMRFNHWHGSPWHFVLDGKDHIVKETSTADPVNALKKFDTTLFLPSKAFLSPLAYTWSTTKGADLIWTPMPFKRSLQIAYSRTHYGTGYYIYHLFADGDRLSAPIRSWNGHHSKDRDVLELVGRAGTDIAPKNIKKLSGTLLLNRSGKLLIADVVSPSSVIRAFKLSIPIENAIDLENLRVLVTWDDSKYPSINAPLSLFFGAGTLYNRDHHEYLVKAFPVNIRYDYAQGKVELSCYYPMPFFKSAKFEIAGVKACNSKINYEIRYEPWKFSPEQSSYFHATYNDFPAPEAGKDLVLLDTRGMEGHQRWSGNFVGTSFIFSHNGVLGTLEGDPRFFFDDSQTPQAYGTGTEEWGGGGDYWGGRNMTLPFAGHPCGAASKKNAKDSSDLIESAYRFLLGDMMPFGERAVITLEHGGWNLSKEHYETVTYWYGLPAVSLIETDSIDIGNVESEKSHEYNSPDASKVEQVVSRYEWGIDTIPRNPEGEESGRGGAEVYPSHEEDERFTRGASTFTVALNPDNYGALIRRTLDYSFPNQKAKVYVADGAEDNPKWKYAGIWYLAGSNTCVYSNPGKELDGPAYQIETSDRRFRDDEFLISSKLTRGLKRLKVKLLFVPSNRKLYPGADFPKESAWSELRYAIYSYVMPSFFVN